MSTQWLLDQMDKWKTHKQNTKSHVIHPYKIKLQQWWVFTWIFSPSILPSCVYIIIPTHHRGKKSWWCNKHTCTVRHWSGCDTTDPRHSCLACRVWYTGRCSPVCPHTGCSPCGTECQDTSTWVGQSLLDIGGYLLKGDRILDNTEISNNEKYCISSLHLLY